MAARVSTVAFQGIGVLDIDCQVQMTGGPVTIMVVGLPDKAVGESRERVRAALHALGISMPPQRLIVNLAPADVMKEGSHFDLPIALSLLVLMGVLPGEELDRFYALGELGLDGSIIPVAGVLPAAINAAANDKGLICPAPCGGEAAWAGCSQKIVAAGLELEGSIFFIPAISFKKHLSPPVKTICLQANLMFFLSMGFPNRNRTTVHKNLPKPKSR